MMMRCAYVFSFFSKFYKKIYQESCGTKSSIKKTFLVEAGENIHPPPDMTPRSNSLLIQMKLLANRTVEL
jgi:hypothetical protein